MPPSPGLRSALIVIGSSATRFLYADYLVWRGVSVREVTSAVAARDHLSAFTPDAAVIEDRLADGSGLDFVRSLRRSRGTALLPIALLSSDVFGINLSRARACGCDTLLNVPCLPETLFESLVALVAQRTAEPRDPPADTWLFAGHEGSVMIARTGETELSVSGPGRQRRTFTFASELDLIRFQVRYERGLVNAGYTLEAFRTDRRTMPDRRAVRRGPDRRGE